jgi:hypothetical protein
MDAALADFETILNEEVAGEHAWRPGNYWEGSQPQSR